MLATSTSCSGPMSTDDHPGAMRTDRAVYALGSGIPPEAPVVFTFTNPQPQPVFVAHCGPYSLAWTVERAGDGGWRPVRTQECAAVLQPALEIPPGGSVTDTARIGPGPQVTRDELGGPLRLVLEVYAADSSAMRHDARGLVPLDLRMSAPFRVR